MSAKKKTISIPETLYAKAVQRAKKLDYPTFSDYVAALVRADTRPPEEQLREEPPPYGTPKGSAPSPHDGQDKN